MLSRFALDAASGGHDAEPCSIAKDDDIGLVAVSLIGNGRASAYVAGIEGIWGRGLGG